MKKILSTTCTMDCPDSCTLHVEVRDGRIVSIGGSPENPTTAGFICSKISRFDRRVYHEKRILTPLRRTGAKGSGRFAPLSWDEALDEISNTFSAIRRDFGGQAIVPYHYGGSNGLMGDDFIDDLYFARLGASRLAKTLCSAPTTTAASAMYGKIPGVAYQDYIHARCIVIWGANPRVSHIHLMPFLKQARKKGARIIAVDPVRNFSSGEIDMHIAVRPGTDRSLALALINYMEAHDLLDHDFISHHTIGSEKLIAAAREQSIDDAAEICGIEPEQIVRLAETYTQSNPALIRCGWGVERNRNGTHAVAAILTLPAMAGKFGVRGGGYTLSNSAAMPFNRQHIIGSPEWNTRILNMTEMGRWLQPGYEPPVKAIFIYNCNPVAGVPNQQAVIRGLERTDLFTVVFEQVMTDSAVYADIVLPAVTFMEQVELKRSYGAYHTGGVQPVIPPVGESRPNETVFAELGRRMGWTDEAFQLSSEELFERSAAQIKISGNPSTAGDFRNGQFVSPAISCPVQFVDVFPATKDGKVDLFPDVLAGHAYREEKTGITGYPLQLVSPASNRMITSTLGEFNFDRLEIQIHPDDARDRKISDNRLVEVYNELGAFHAHARISRYVRRGVVSAPKGAWRFSSPNGMTTTAVCPDTTEPVSGGACYNDARVEIRNLEGS